MIVATGIMQTIAGTGEQGYAGDGELAIAALLSEPFMCAFDAQGHMFVAEATNHCIRRIDTQTGVITTIAGTGELGYSGDGGPATEATLNQPYGRTFYFCVKVECPLFPPDSLTLLRRAEADSGGYGDGSSEGVRGTS